MDKYSSLHREIHSLTTLISLIFQRPPECINYGQLGDDNPSSKGPEQGTDKELEKLSDEAEFEDEVPTDDSAAALVLLKQRSLDRLAEILARFKTAKTGPYGKGKRNQGNIDAKHVASVVMVEDSSLHCVTFLCSKNEGLQEEDEVFLGRLDELLSFILKDIGPKEAHESQVFDLIFEHNRPRAFEQASRAKLSDTLTADVMKHVVPQTLEAREWEGLIIGIDGRQPELSREALDCLSDKDRDEAVVEVCVSIQTLFGMSDLSTTHYDELRDFLRRFYTIIQNPRQRPALKNLLMQALHGRKKLFKKAWDALLFLARTFHAAVTLVELASRLKLEHFNSFRFISVPVSIFKTKSYPPLGKGLPLDDLIALQCRPQHNGWVGLLQDKGTVRNYRKLLRIPRSVHAEVQLMMYLEGRYSDSVDQVFPYIGCSKKCCFFCDMFRVFHGKFWARGTHETVFPRWGLPQDVLAGGSLEWLAPLMSTFAAFLRDILHTALSMPYPLPHRNLCQQSSAALSTAQARQDDEPRYSEKPSTLRLTPGQAEVFKLFIAIQPSIWQVPDINSSAWINFGFCYCNATFDDIVSAYETSTMAELMGKHGIDVPSGTIYSVFRLMSGVSHALSGRFCSCFRMQHDHPYHRYFETHLDAECEVGFGFDMTNSWERWQLLNFYRHVFKLPVFDPRAMAAAKDIHEHGALERYLDTLVPDMRRKIFDMDRAGSALFPILGARIMVTTKGAAETSSSHLSFYCRVHDVLGPPGLCYRM
ncbi:hypothetical protein BDV32DRAFT_137204 [Aspergillus pseudonomiae]|nr:hypothetical protein BDV32DRAFT_137204 [Aspergillus pseudonomiae]